MLLQRLMGDDSAVEDECWVLVGDENKLSAGNSS